MALKKYIFVSFVNESRNDSRVVEFVPSSWIRSTNGGKNSFETKFLAPSEDGKYTEDQYQMISSFVKKCAIPPETWPWYSVVICGGVDSYTQAKRRLPKLKKKATVFSSSDEEMGAKLRSLIKALKSKRKSLDAQKVDCILNGNLDSSSETNDRPKQPTSTENSEFESLFEENSYSEDERPEAKKNKLSLEESTKRRSKILKGNKCNGNGSSRDQNFSGPSSRNVDMSVSMRDILLHVTKEIDGLKKEIKREIRHESNILKMKISETHEAINNKLMELEVMMSAHSNASFVTPADLTAKYNITIPMNNEEMFNNMNKLMNTDADFRNDIIKMMNYATPNGKLTGSLSTAMKYFFEKEFMLRFVAAKETPNKIVLKSTIFYASLYNVYAEKRPTTEMNEKLFSKAMGAVISNAKDWNGGRSKRKQQQTHNQETP